MKCKNDTLTDKDKNLMKAMDMFQKEWVAKYPDKLEIDENFAYSKRHIKRMDRMLKNHDSWFYRATCTPKRQVVAAVLAVFISLNTVMITSVEARAIVVNFFVTVYETFSDVLFPNDFAPSEIVDCYEPSYVPDGYSVDYTHKGTKEIYIDYIDSNGEIISFVQAIIDKADLGVDTENSNIETVVINQTEGLIIFNKNRYSLHWSDAEYRYNLIGSDKSEIIKMAESLKIIKEN